MVHALCMNQKPLFANSRSGEMTESIAHPPVLLKTQGNQINCLAQKISRKLKEEYEKSVSFLIPENFDRISAEHFKYTLFSLVKYAEYQQNIQKVQIDLS